jgi:hypothetical protein
MWLLHLSGCDGCIWLTDTIYFLDCSHYLICNETRRFGITVLTSSGKQAPNIRLSCSKLLDRLVTVLKFNESGLLCYYIMLYFDVSEFCAKLHQWI